MPLRNCKKVTFLLLKIGQKKNFGKGVLDFKHCILGMMWTKKLITRISVTVYTKIHPTYPKIGTILYYTTFSKISTTSTFPKSNTTYPKRSTPYPKLVTCTIKVSTTYTKISTTYPRISTTYPKEYSWAHWRACSISSP